MLTIYSDPHLGTVRKAHTTPESSKRLNQRLFEQVRDIVAAPEGETLLCLGDLFDKTNNDEATFLQGYQIAAKTLWTLAGNHDVANREGVISTLEAVHNVLSEERSGCSIIMPPAVGGSDHTSIRMGDYRIVMVPHHSSQEAFVRTLNKVLTEDYTESHAYLMLHCNVEFDLADNNDAVLNLTAEMSDKLLTKFSRIFVGHEHNSYTKYDDRLVVVGNTHPTSFSDISDKYVWSLNGSNNTLQKTCVWSKAHSYLELPYNTDLSSIEHPERYQFIDVVGRESTASGVDVAKYINSARKTFHNAFMIRQNVELVDVLARVDSDAAKPALVDLPGRIASDLEGTDLLDLWNELHEDVQK